MLIGQPSDQVEAFKAALREGLAQASLIKKQKKTRPAPHIYEQAKNAETKLRDLPRSLELYLQALRRAEKIDSVIKDVPAVLHQMGETTVALRLMEDPEVAAGYSGDSEKYQRLIENFKSQVSPTGKHDIRMILIDAIVCFEDVCAMFGNTKRVKEISSYYDLSFQLRCDPAEGRYYVLSFESFSAAKKTLSTFNEGEWFWVNKYWLNARFEIVCQADDGRTDFEEGLVIQPDQLRSRVFDLETLGMFAHYQLLVSHS